jgi:hypothetical protein
MHDHQLELDLHILSVLSRLVVFPDKGIGLGLTMLEDLDLPFSASSARKSGSTRVVEEPSADMGGLEAGDTNGEVCNASGILSLVSNTKNASPPSPNFMA